MCKLLFTTLPSNDLGLLTRSLPIACELRALGHEVAFCSPGAAPRKLIADAGFEQRIPDDPLYNKGDVATTVFRLLGGRRWHELRLLVQLLGTMRRLSTAEIWNLDHFVCLMGLGDVEFVRLMVATLMRLIRAHQPDAIVDFWTPLACIAARATRTPLVGVLQADTHPDSRGFMWWRDVPSGLPTPVPALNQVLSEVGLPPVTSASDLLVGDLTLVLGIPEIDPLPPSAQARYVGAVLWEKAGSTVPDWIVKKETGAPTVWVYPGNMRYVRGAATPFDSLVVLEGCVEALRNERVEVVVSTGHQPLPRHLRRLPANFRHESYLPGLAMAERCSVMIHHGGYGSCQTGLWAGRPAVIVPTFSERESNARRVAAAGAGIVVVPEADASGIHKRVNPAALRDAVRTVLADPSYARNAARVAGLLRSYGGPVAAAKLVAEFVAQAPAA